jgi:hypothetical protein
MYMIYLHNSFFQFLCGAHNCSSSLYHAIVSGMGEPMPVYVRPAQQAKAQNRVSCEWAEIPSCGDQIAAVEQALSFLWLFGILCQIASAKLLWSVP